jgi:hypothetical protein
MRQQREQADADADHRGRDVVQEIRKPQHDGDADQQRGLPLRR